MTLAKPLEQPPESLEAFLTLAPGVVRGLNVLSAAESLTDGLAATLLENVDPRGQGSALVKAISRTDLIVRSGFEWRFTDSVRSYLHHQLANDPPLLHRTHETLLSMAAQSGLSEPPRLLPSYLRSGVGVAYHTAMFDPEEALRGYVAAGSSGSPGAAWLALRLAREQEDDGVLPGGSAEVAFLSGFLPYKEGRFEDALRVFVDLANVGEENIFVAMAAHLAAVILMRSKDPIDQDRAEELLTLSLNQGKLLEDGRHIALVSHTLGRLLWDRGRVEDARDLLLASLAWARQAEDDKHVAYVLHSLGRLHASTGRLEAALSEFAESLSIGERLHDARHQAQVTFEQGKLAEQMTDYTLAERAYLRSRSLDRSIGNMRGVRMVSQRLQRLRTRRL